MSTLKKISENCGPLLSPVVPSQPKKSDIRKSVNASSRQRKKNEKLANNQLRDVQESQQKSRRLKDGRYKMPTKPLVPRQPVKKKNDVTNEPPEKEQDCLPSIPSFKKAILFSNEKHRELPDGAQAKYRRDMMGEDIRVNRMRLIVAKIEAKEMVMRLEDQREKKAMLRRRRIRKQRKIEYHAANTIQNFCSRHMASWRWQKQNEAARTLQKLIKIHKQIKESKVQLAKARDELQRRRACVFLEDKLYRYALRRKALQKMSAKRKVKLECRQKVLRQRLNVAAMKIQKTVRGMLGRRWAKRLQHQKRLKDARTKLLNTTFQKARVVVTLQHEVQQAKHLEKQEQMKKEAEEKSIELRRATVLRDSLRRASIKRRPLRSQPKNIMTSKMPGFGKMTRTPRVRKKN